MATNPFWLNKLKEEGVTLIVEIPLTIKQFRALVADGFGRPPSDDELVELYQIVGRRILPPDPGSFSGIGFDVNRLVKSRLPD